MDPVSHVAFGRILIALAPETRSPRAVVHAAILGALCPDIDAVWMPVRYDEYLRIHEIGTHTLVGIPACAVLSAAVVRLFARNSPYGVLALAAGLGAASHVLLDLVSGARLRVGWPAIDGHATIPLVAMADPALFGVLVVGMTAVWVARQRRLVARAALIAVTALLGLKAFFFMQAFSAYRVTVGPESGLPRVVEASWGTLRTWNIFDRTSDRLRAWRVSAAQPGAVLTFSWPISRETPAVTASRSLPTVRNGLRVHDLLFPATQARWDGGSRVMWSDIRYCWKSDTARWRPAGLLVSASSGVEVGCLVWFGADYDAHGRALQQVVKVGPFTQTRAVDR